MYKGTVIITGVGFRKLKVKYPQTDDSTMVTIDNIVYKINPSIATTIHLLNSGYKVIIITDCAICINLIEKMALGSACLVLRYCLLHNRDPISFLSSVVSFIEENLHIVHYGSATNVKNKKIDTIFLDPWSTPGDVVGEMINNNIASFYSLLQNLRSLLQSQSITKVLIISAVAALRTGKNFGLDAIQKGAVHSMARSLAIDLTKEGIYITEIMPGTTDSGYYDNPATVRAKVERGREFGYIYDPNDLPLLAPMRIAETVTFVLDTPAHFREISLIPYGQHPHLGA